MQGILSSKTTVIAVLLLLIAGLLLTRFLGRRMGDARRATRGDVNRVLADLAAAMGGRFEEGGKLIAHPLLGEVREYGTTHLTRGPFTVAVSVSYPGDDARNDRTTVRIQRPAQRHWRVEVLRQRRRAPASIEPGQGDAELARCFEIAGGEALPGDARASLLQVGALTGSIDLKADTLELVAAPDGHRIYITDAARLRALVEQALQLAEALLTRAST